MPKKSKKVKKEFSKALLIQESTLIWVITLSCIALAFYCVVNQYFGELPWITALAGFPWTAYAVSQACYYKKAEKENTKNGIKYDTTMAQFQTFNPDIYFTFPSDDNFRGFDESAQG